MHQCKIERTKEYEINIINQNEKTQLEMEHQQNIGIIKLSTYGNIVMVLFGTDYVYRFKCNVDVNKRRDENES